MNAGRTADRGTIAILGVGLIGGSIAMGLRRAGYVVRGFDHDPRRTERAVALEAIDTACASVADAVAGASCVFVAAPVSSIADLVCVALDAGATVVTDVGSVKGPIVGAVEATRRAADRYVGGHPMAGSEQEGVDGSNASMFTGATWVLTPTERTDPAAYTTVRALVHELGAEAVAVDAAQHDRLVATVSHVPHLAAGTLMRLADERSHEHALVLRLAAGGFRDMTRIAAGDPRIWPDICSANRDAIVETLDVFVEQLREARDVVARGDRDRLNELLVQASVARRNLPTSAATSGPLAEMRVPVLDRPGVIAEVATIAGERNINIFDLETVHSTEGGPGVLVLIVPAPRATELEQLLSQRGYKVAWRELQ